ncbi:MAG: type II secretion system protein [Candidatus Omnitrophota bacterium]|nr:type II secretion system protein [Candidatus Omnitrophota bacterium]
MTSGTGKRGGFTFVELLLVILFIGALAAISIPRFKKTVSGLQLDNFVKDIYYLSRYLQGASGAQGKIYCLNISPDGFQAVEGAYKKKYNLPPGVSMSIEPQPISELYFYPDSSMDKTANISFSDPYDKKITLVFKGATGGIGIK